jgi:GNAT superfamily N-acetyltransferase
MNCTIQTADEFWAGAAGYVRHNLTKPGSDFQRKLDSWLYEYSRPTDADGHIALVEDHGEIIGWARTEKWLEDGGAWWNTLESFVHKSYRRRGIAAFAASGLYSALFAGYSDNVAVFHPHMLLVARRAGLYPTLFKKTRSVKWERQ